MKLQLALFLVFLSFSAGVFAQNSPRIPFYDRGACPFECCTYRTWIARKNISLLKEMRTTSPVVFRIKRGQSVKALTGVVITTKAGVVEAVKNTKFENLSISKGARLYVLTYLGEGFSKIWHRGKIYESDVSDNQDLKVISRPNAVWWVQIKNKKGQIGWTNLSDSFDNQDACG